MSWSASWLHSLNWYAGRRNCGSARTFRKGDASKIRVGAYFFVVPQVLSRSYDECCDLWS